jgi:hypothetical protein
MAQRQLAKDQVPDSRCHKLTACRPTDAETDVFWNLLRRFLKNFERNRLREITCENKILLYCHLRTQWGTCPIRVVLRNESKEIILLCELVRLSDGSQLGT